MNDENSKKLFNALSEDYDMGSYDKFVNDIQDEGKRRKLYDAIVNDYDLPDFDSFSKQLGITGAPSVNAAGTVVPDTVRPDGNVFTESQLEAVENGAPVAAKPKFGTPEYASEVISDDMPDNPYAGMTRQQAVNAIGEKYRNEWFGKGATPETTQNGITYGGEGAFGKIQKELASYNIASPEDYGHITAAIRNRYVQDVARQRVEGLLSNFKTVNGMTFDDIQGVLDSRAAQQAINEDLRHLGLEQEDKDAYYQELEKQLEGVLVNKYGYLPATDGRGSVSRFASSLINGGAGAHDDRILQREYEGMVAAQYEGAIQGAFDEAYGNAAKTEADVMKSADATKSSSLGYSLMAAYESNKQRDPDTILKAILEKVSSPGLLITENQSMLDRALEDAAARDMDINEYIERYIAPAIQKSIMREFQKEAIRREMPRDDFEYVMRGLSDDSIIGMIISSLVRTDSQTQYRDMANAQYGEGANIWLQGARMATGMASDFWLWGGWGKLGGAATRSLLNQRIMSLAATKHITREAATRILEEEARQYLSKGMFEQVMRHVPQSSITMGGAEATTEAVRGYTRNEEIGDILKNTFKTGMSGAATGIVFGVTGGASSRLTSQLTGVKRLAGKLAGLEVEAATLYTTEELQRMMSGEDAFENPFEGLFEANVKLGFIKASANPVESAGKLYDAMAHPVKRVKGMMEPEKKVLNDADVADLRDSFDGKGLVDALTTMRPIRHTDGSEREGYITEEKAAIAAQAYNDYIKNPDRPIDRKQRVARLLGGIVPPTGREVRIDIDTTGGETILRTRDIDGQCVQELHFDNEEAAKAEAEKLAYEIDQNTTEALHQKIDMYDSFDRLDKGIEDVYQAAADKMQAGEELTDEEQTAVYLRQNKARLLDITGKTDEGQPLTEEEQKLADIFERYFVRFVQEGRASKAFMRDWEQENGLEPGILEWALRGHSREELEKMQGRSLPETAGQEDDVITIGDDRFRTAEEARIVEDYHQALREHIAEKESVDAEPATEGAGTERRTRPATEGAGTERREGDADGEAGADGTGGNEPPVSPSTERTAEPERPAEKPATEVSGTERRPAGEAAGTAAGEAAGTVRSERRQVAYDRGAEAVKNPARLAGVVYDRTLANTRLNVLLPDSDPILGHLRRDIIKAAEEGNDAEIDRLVDANLGSLNAQQREAIELWRDAEEMSRGFDDAVPQEVQAYEQRRREELKEITNDEGNIVELSLRDGRRAYHLSGDMKNRYSGIMVKPDDGEPEMVPVEHTTVTGEAMPMEEVLRGDVDAYGRELEQNLASLAEGSSFMTGATVDFVTAGRMFTGVVAGEDAAGNVVFQMDDNSMIPMSPQDARQAVQDATLMKIQAQLRQEKDAAMEMQRNERYSKGIVGYTEGKPDLSNKKTDARAAAEYLQGMAADEKSDGHSEALKGVETEISNLMEQRDYSEETVNRLSVKQELQGLSEQEEIALSESQQSVDEAGDRRRKWGEIRQALMTDEERHKFEAEKQKDIKKAMDAAEPATEGAGTGRRVPTGKELLEKYEEQGDAENAVEAMRAELKSRYMNELYPKVSAVRDAFNDYRQGLTDKTPDELKQMAAELKVLEAEEKAMTEKSIALKNLASSLGRVYAGRKKQQLSPHEYKMQQLERETNREKKLKLAKEAFKEDDEAMDVLNDTEPADVYEWVAANLGQGSLNFEGLQRGEHYVRGVSDMIGKDKKRGLGKDSDTIGYNDFLAPTGQGKGWDEVVHSIAEGSPYSTEDVGNALYDMLTSASKPTDISHRIVDDRIARAEDIYESNLEREREAEEEAKTGIITNDVNETGNDAENDVILQQEPSEEEKVTAKANADALRSMSPAITEKYSSYPVEVVDFLNDDIRQLFKELFDKEPTDEELHSFIDEGLSMKAKAVFIGKTGKIYVFAHNTSPDILEEFVFHENIHPLLEELDEASRNSLFETYWNNSTTPESEADKELIKSDYPEEEWYEEFFVHHLAHKMKNGTTGKFFERLTDEQQAITDNILKEIRYDRESETKARRATKAEPLGEPEENGEGSYSEGSGDDGRVKRSAIQGLEDYSEEEIKKYVREFVQEQVEMADADAEIVDIAIIGSRTTGTAKPDSDLDVLVEYKGKEREDDFYNLLDDADEPLTIGGISVDINPITEGKSGTIAQFLERNKDYKKEEPVTDVTGTETEEPQNFSARLAEAKGETNTNPSEEQKKAGNYKMGHISFGGYRMSIENPKGSTRSGKDANGKAWSIEMQDTYGYIGKKYGTDGDHLDFFINDDADLDSWNGRVYVVDQKNEDGSFDEHKVMYGYPTFKAAKEAYERNYEAGWWDKHVQAMTGVTKETFDKWLNDSDHKRKPFAEYSRTKNAETITDNVDQLLADVRERAMKNVDELANVKPSYKDGELEKRTIAELEHLKEKRKKDASVARYSMKAFNIEEGSEKEHTLKMNEAKAKADIAAIDEVLERKEANDKARLKLPEFDFMIGDVAREDETNGGEKRDENIFPFGKNVVSLQSELAREAVDGQKATLPKTAPWREGVEEVTIHTTLNAIRKKYGELHEKAKAGDNAAAEELVSSVVKPDKVKAIVDQHPNAQVAYVHAEESTGKNKLPVAYAALFEEQGLKLSDVVQTNKPSHTGSDRVGRFVRRARFDGEVEPGAEYIIVDDHVTMGGTLRDLKDYIESKGGKVVAVTTLTASAGGTKLRPTDEQIQQLKDKGITNEQLKELGIADSIDGLTRREAAEILVLADKGGDSESSRGRKAVIGGNPRTEKEAPADGIGDKSVEASIVSLRRSDDNGLNLNDPLGRKLSRLKKEAGPNGLVGYTDSKTGDYVILGNDADIVRSIAGNKFTVYGEQDGMQMLRIPSDKLDIVSPKVIREGYKMAFTTDEVDATDKMLDEVERRKEVASQKESEKRVREYLDKHVKGQDAEVRKRATKAVLKAMDKAGVPYKVVSKEEERQMMQIFSMMNQESVKAFCRRADIRSTSRHGFGRYCVYNMADPFAVPMYHEKLSNAKEDVKQLKRMAPQGAWEILDIGYKDEAVEMPEELKEAANFQAMMGWHGSNALFVKFDSGYAYKGAGSMSFGWGTYLTSGRGVAEGYAHLLTKGFQFDGKTLDDYKPVLSGSPNRTSTIRDILVMLNSGRDFNDTVGLERSHLESAIKDYEDNIGELSAADIEDLNLYKAELKFINSLKPEDFQKSPEILYKVEMPDDTGDNYLDYMETLPKSQRRRIAEAVRNLEGKPKQSFIFANYKDGWNSLANMIEREQWSYKDIHDRILMAFGGKIKDAERVSKLMNSIGFVGIKYPAGTIHGGGDGATNYVIFNEDDAKIVDTIQFMVEMQEDKPVFFSNAMKAVEGIKQEKATPEQWLKMIEKAGGLKAGEDKWMGLSEWLTQRKNAGHGGSVTKQEVMDFIRQNQIEVEDVNYSESIDIDNNPKMQQFRNEFDRLVKELRNQKDALIRETEAFDSEMFEKYGEGWAYKLTGEDEKRYNELSEQYKQWQSDTVTDIAFQKMLESHGDDFGMAFEVNFGNGKLEPQMDMYGDDMSDAAKHFLELDEQSIDSTRLGYTTEGLENKKEIALTVPTIEPYNEDDQIHFGDAGGGRAVAWVRFGDTEIEVPALGLDKSKYTAKPSKQGGFDVYRPNGSEWGRIGAATSEQAIAEAYQDDINRNSSTQRVLVIDEIQSKRHQDARELGYQGEFVDSPKKQYEVAYDKLMEYKQELDEKYGEYHLLDQLTPEERAKYDEMYQKVVALSEVKDDKTYTIPDAPFEKNWHELAMKRMLRYAAEHGYDKVAWTKGEQQAERYNIGNAVNKIITYDYPAVADAEGRNSKKIEIRLRSGETMTMRVNEEGKVIEGRSNTEGKNLTDVVGKDLARRIMEGEGKDGTIFDADRDLPAKVIEGDGLRIGGEGMKGFYDQMLPRFMEKYCKKWGVKPYMIDLPEIGQKMHVVDITPEMRESVMQGQPMFQKEGKKILGWSDGKQVYLTEAGLNPNTPLHETTHLWDKWCQKEKPELWEKVVDAMKKTAMWEEISKNPNYRNIWNDDNRMASEVHARLSGAKGEDEFMKAAFKKDTPQSIIDEVKSVLKKFWESILRLFGKTTKTIGDEWSSLDAIIRMPLRDLLNQDFEKVMKVAEGESDAHVEGHIVEDKDEIARLDAEPKEVGYRNVVVNEDGTLGSPMANKPQGTVKPEPREISATDYQKNNAFIEHDQQFVDYISGKTGISFNKNKNSNSWYGNKDGREIRISDHFNKRTDQDKYYFNEDADYIVAKINGVNPFKHFLQGDTIHHIAPKIGDVEFVSYDEDKGFVEVRLSDGTVHKYDEEKFSSPENFKFQKAVGDVEAPDEFDAAVRDKLIDDYLKPTGISFYSDAEAEKILEEGKEGVKLNRDKKRALKTASVSQQEEHQPTVVSSASGAKVLKDLDNLVKYYENISGQQSLYSGEYKDRTGLAVPEEVNIPKFFKTSDGEVYGFALNGKIGIDRRTAKADTPIHEYGHLWAAALRKVNPEEWKNVVKMMKGVKDVWDAVKRDYADLKTEDDIAEEVLTQYSGKRGRERFYEERERVLNDQSISGDEKVRLFTIFENVKRALHAFWGRVADFLHIRYTSAEQVADQVLGDLLSGVNPEREARKYASETGRIKAKAERDGTFMKAPDGSRSKLSEKGWLAARTEDFKKWIGGDWEALSGKTAEHTVDESLRNKLDRNGEPQEKYVQGYLERPRKPGKPNKKDSETMAEYFNRLRLWEQAIKDWPDTVEQWKAVVYRHDGSALPDETAIHEKWMQKYEDDLKKWKEDNALAPDAEAPTEKPVAGDADPLDFTKTMADWRRSEALWKTAPDKQDYEREAEAEVYSMLAALELKHHPMSYSARMRQMGASLKQIREAVLTQKHYDQTTVQSVVDFAKNFMSMGFGDNIGRGDLEGILTSVKRAVGARSIRDSVDSIMEKLVDNHLRNLSNFLEKLTNVKDKRLNPTGVEVQGELDLEGQRAINEFRRMRATRLTPDEINVRLGELADKIMNDPENRSQWEAEYDGAHAALTYAEGVAANKKACMDAENAIRDAVKSYSQSGRSYAAQQELLASLHRGLSDLLFERIDLYGQMFDELGGILGESRERAKEFREAEKARVFNIHRLANIDMAGKDANETHPQGWKQALNNSAVTRLPLSSLGTFEQLMKQFGSRHPNGEGRLYNHFMRGYIDAVNNEQVGLENAKGMLDAKASEVFGKKMQWSHLYYLERSMPTMDVAWRDGEGNQHSYTLSQGNMLAIYMWNKMHDGQMKLRKMDISDEDVMRITEHIDERLLTLADWVQQEFLPTLRTKYNKVHEQEFGASMAEIENYFPLRIVKDSIQKDDDLTADPSMDSVLPSTTTGSIIKRTVNAKPLDILNTDALSLIIEHIEEMEKWAAFTHWNKDVNTLLSYNRFKNQVKNMDTVYGSGDELWDAFRAACQLAAGSYRPKHGKADKAMTVIASGVTSAKIAFLPYTALKQLLSAPAFLYDADPAYFALYFCNPKNFFHDNFVWAMENIPALRKRWHSRDMGDTRLSDKTGFGYWHTQTKKWVAQYGMWANGMIDVLTCSAGARAVYETRLKNYKKQGLDEARAKEKALQDAAIAYNTTQQSSEGAFVAPIQKDRTLFANMWTVFRNSSMSYTRQSVDALRNLKRMYSNRQDMLYSLERTFREEEGLREEDAKIAARAEFKRALWKNMAKVAVCAFVLPWLWELGSKIPYLLFGDDDELKKRMLGDVTRKELVCGPLEGLTFGNAINSLWGAASNHEVMDSLNKTTVWKAVSDAEVQPLPMFSDMGTMLEKFGYDKAAAIQDMVNIACQMATGVNPQTLTDPINAAIDASRGDLTKAKEIELFLMRVMMVPTESAQNIYLDELGMDAKKAQGMTYDELAERYAKYKFGKSAPMFGWAYSDEAEAKRMESYMKRFDKTAEDRIHLKDESALRRQYERSESQKERKLIGKEVAARQDSEDYYVKNPGSTEVSKQRRSYYLMNRSWQDILEDIELERINREAKANNDSDKQRAVKAARKRIDAAINSLTVDKNAWSDLREARTEAITSLK